MADMTRSRALRTERTTAQIIRAYRGPALFSFGFRPFFLLAGGFAALAIPLWIGALLGGGGLAGALARDWHVHEMLYGYTAAVIIGYMIIAGANWTGHYPVAGLPVMLLAGLWLAGRAAMLLAGPDKIAAMAIDAAFLPLFAAALWREQIAARNRRNLVPCVVVALLAMANIAFHLRGIWPDLGPASERMALGVIALLIVVMGGRLVPSFTRNWLVQRRSGREPIPYGRFDLTVALVTAGALALWQWFPYARGTGLCLMLAGGANLVRMIRWRGWETWREPLVWSLHLGYLWLAFGFFLLGASLWFGTAIPATAAIHALAAGGIGVMTLAMMMRTTLSHTGRVRRGGVMTLIALLLINGAALLRIAAPFAPVFVAELLIASTVLWSGAFLIFTVVYGPMLATRKTPRAGRA